MVYSEVRRSMILSAKQAFLKGRKTSMFEHGIALLLWTDALRVCLVVSPRTKVRELLAADLPPSTMTRAPNFLRKEPSCVRSGYELRHASASYGNYFRCTELTCSVLRYEVEDCCQRCLA